VKAERRCRHRSFVGWAKRSVPTIKAAFHGKMVSTAKCAFAHPHMRAFESSVPTGGLGIFVGIVVAAARGAMRIAACRRGRCAQGLASGDICSSSLHHLISGRTVVRTHIPHACGEEATRMRPIYETARLLAQGWHGHHPSRADHGRCRDADAFVEVFTPLLP